MNAVFYSEIFGTAQLVAEDVVGVKSAQPAEFLDVRGKYEPACVVLQLIYMRGEGIYSICVDNYRSGGIINQVTEQTVGFVTVAYPASEQDCSGGTGIFAQLVRTVGSKRFTAERKVDTFV